MDIPGLVAVSVLNSTFLPLAVKNYTFETTIDVYLRKTFSFQKIQQMHIDAKEVMPLRRMNVKGNFPDQYIKENKETEILKSMPSKSSIQA